MRKLLIASVLLLPLAACSDDSDGGGGGGGGADKAKFCKSAENFEKKMNSMDSVFSTENPNPDDIGKAFEAILTNLDEMLNDVPSEIKDDAKTMQDGLSAFNDLLKKYDYDIMKIFLDENAAKEFEKFGSNADFEKSGQAIEDYLKNACGLSGS